MEVYIKRSGSSMMDLEMGNVLTLDLDGNVIQGEGSPSKEVNFHLGIYKSRKEVGAVLHVHPPFATAFATSGIELPIITVPAKIVLKKIPTIEYIPPGTVELAKRVVESFKDTKVCSLLLKGHGLISIGKGIDEAYHIAEWTENAAHLVFLTSVLRNLKEIAVPFDK
jgi:L-fuculose-phosphate aldolase